MLHKPQIPVTNKYTYLTWHRIQTLTPQKRASNLTRWFSRKTAVSKFGFGSWRIRASKQLSFASGSARPKIIIKHFGILWIFSNMNKKHLKNVGPICDCEPPHTHSPGVATGTVAHRLRIDVHDDDDDNDNAWQRGPLWPHGMGPIISVIVNARKCHTDGKLDQKSDTYL